MTGLSSIMSSMFRLSLAPVKQNVIARNFWSRPSLDFRVSQCLQAEPLKRKKRLDPAIIRAREDRRRRKIEKAIKKLAKQAKQFKNIEELEVPLALIDERSKRIRAAVQVSEEEEVKRLTLHQSWSVYCRNQLYADIKEIDRLTASQQKALDELRLESEELYQDAIQPDLQIVNFRIKGVTLTPPIKDYDSPDGEYIDVSQKWEN